ANPAADKPAAQSAADASPRQLQTPPNPPRQTAAPGSSRRSAWLQQRNSASLRWVSLTWLDSGHCRDLQGIVTRIGPNTTAEHAEIHRVRRDSTCFSALLRALGVLFGSFVVLTR